MLKLAPYKISHYTVLPPAFQPPSSQYMYMELDLVKIFSYKAFMLKYNYYYGIAFTRLELLIFGGRVSMKTCNITC